MRAGRGPLSLDTTIVTWQNAGEIERCLASLINSAQHAGVELRAIVVDNASQDGTAELIRDKFPRIELIANKTNRLFAAANNQALRKLDTDLILLLNPDVELGESTLSCLILTLEADSDIAAVAPQLVFPDGAIQRSCRAIPGYDTVFLEATGLARLFPSRNRWRYPRFDHRSSRDVDQPMASCLLLRTSAFDTVGRYLDERLPLYFNDVELALRMKRSDLRTRFVAEARAVHILSASTSRARVRSAVEHSCSFIRFLWNAYPTRRSHMIWATPLLALVGLIRAGSRALD
jgi:GT2 family glycosyltransferase